MIKLLNSDFTRFRMNRMFWFCIFLPAIPEIIYQIWVAGEAEAWRITWKNSDKLYMFNGSTYYLDYHLFTLVFVIALASALFCSYYVGVEHHNGILRNKITVGHSRRDIYLSLFITNAAAGCGLCSVYLIVNLCTGIPLLGTFHFFGRNEIVMFLICVYASIIALTAILTLITMLVSNTAVSGMLCIGIVLILLYFSLNQIWSLSTPEIFPKDAYIGFFRIKHYSAGSQHPAYVPGVRRQILLFLLNFLPTGQLIEFYGLSVEFWRSRVLLDNLNPCIMLSGSAFFTVVPTLIGMFLFGKKNLE